MCLSLALCASLVTDFTSMMPFRTSDPVVPAVGDWFQCTTVPLRFYKFSPCQALGHPLSGMARCGRVCFESRTWPGMYIGPCHEVEHTENFVSIRVPSPEDRTALVWTNVWKRGSNGQRSLQIAVKVDSSTVVRWHSMGWEDRYLSLE